MGVSLLQIYPLENRTAQATIEFLSKRILALGGTRQGNFMVDCETYSSIPELGNERYVNVLHSSDHPVSVFSILQSGETTVPLVADGLFDLLMVKMSNFYTPKKQKAESKGPKFEIGDFLIKLGTVTIKNIFKGVLVEVEYQPCEVPMLCWELLKEFSKGFLGSVQLTPSPHLEKVMQDNYSTIDTMHQYLEKFNFFRMPVGKRTSV